METVRAYSPYAPGSMGDFFHFVRQFAVHLFALNRSPGDYLPPEGSNLRSSFVEYLQDNFGGPIDFNFAFVAWPRIKDIDFGKEIRHHPKGDNIHGLLISKFWRAFFDKLISEHGYRKISEDFIKDFLKLKSQSVEGSWAEGFNLHFVDPDIVQPTDRFWKEYVCSEHTASIEKFGESDFTLMSCVNLSGLDTPAESGIGFTAISPKALCERVNKLG